MSLRKFGRIGLNGIGSVFSHYQSIEVPSQPSNIDTENQAYALIYCISKNPDLRTSFEVHLNGLDNAIVVEPGDILLVDHEMTQPRIAAHGSQPFEAIYMYLIMIDVSPLH